MNDTTPLAQRAWWSCGNYRKDHLLAYPDTGYGAWSNCGKVGSRWQIVANREPKKCATCLRLAEMATKP